MIPSGVATALVEAWEGVEDGDPKTAALDCYLDGAGVATFGRGHAVTDVNDSYIRCDPRADVLTRGRTKAAGDARMRQILGHVPTLQDANAILVQDMAAMGVKATRVLGPHTTLQCQFDALTSFAFNEGAGALLRSTLLRLHDAQAPVSQDLNFADIMEGAQNHARITNIPEAFAAYSYSNDAFTLGLFRRRMCELLVYRGDRLAGALQTAQAIS